MLKQIGILVVLLSGCAAQGENDFDDNVVEDNFGGQVSIIANQISVTGGKTSTNTLPNNKDVPRGVSVGAISVGGATSSATGGQSSSEILSTGGSVATGGNISTGGTIQTNTGGNSTGGTSSTGGNISTGGADQASTGGSVSTGGTTTVSTQVSCKFTLPKWSIMTSDPIGTYTLDNGVSSAMIIEDWATGGVPLNDNVPGIGTPEYTKLCESEQCKYYFVFSCSKGKLSVQHMVNNYLMGDGTKEFDCGC